MTDSEPTPDRHLRKNKSWRPNPAYYPEALKAAADVGSNLNAVVDEFLAFLLGLRKDPPPRPEWAERRAASLPDEPPSRPDNGTKDSPSGQP